MIIFHRYHEKGVTTLRQNEYGEAARPCRSIVGYDANALYLWSLMQDMPMGWCTRRRVEKDFRPESAQLYGQMAGEWLTWESERTGRPIRHQINGREKRIGKHRVDGWCSETKTAYQFQCCFFTVARALEKRWTPSTGNPWRNCSPRPERPPPTYVTLSRSSSCGNASGKRWDEPRPYESVWMLHFSDVDTCGGRWRRNRSWTACVQEPCSAWSSATFACRKNCASTLPRCSPCSRTSVWYARISVRSCAATPKSTT